MKINFVLCFKFKERAHINRNVTILLHQVMTQKSEILIKIVNRFLYRNIGNKSKIMFEKRVSSIWVNVITFNSFQT